MTLSRRWRRRASNYVSNFVTHVPKRLSVAFYHMSSKLYLDLPASLGVLCLIVLNLASHRDATRRLMTRRRRWRRSALNDVSNFARHVPKLLSVAFYHLSSKLYLDLAAFVGV